MGSLGFALGVLGIMRGRCVHSRSRWGSLGSSGVVGFTLVRAGVRWVHSRSLGSFIRDRWVHSVSPWGSLSFLWWSLSSTAVVGFTWVLPGDRWVHPVSIGSIGFALGFVQFIRGRCVHSGSPWGSWVHPESLGSLGFAL